MARWQASLAALLLSAGAAAGADSVAPAPGDVAVTIYHDEDLSTEDLVHPQSPAEVQDQGLAFIVETREVDLPAGPAEIRFRGVASTMVPQTADIEGLPTGTLERNFDYDLLSPGSLLAKSVGETVQLVRTDKATGRQTATPAIVRSGPDGAMLEIDGKLEALGCSGLPEKLVFDKAPDGLTDTPTLSIRTNAPEAGHYRIKLSYIATGLNWTADYVAHVLPGGRTLDLSGWLTLANFGATGFARAPVYALAGRLNVTGDDTPVHPGIMRASLGCWPTNIDWATHNDLWRRLHSPMTGTEMYSASPVTVLSGDGETETVVVTGTKRIDPRQLGDYKLYPLPEPTDLPARETKQVQFLDLQAVPFERIYRYLDESQSSGSGLAQTLLRLQNTVEGGLGKPLPAGDIAVSEDGPDGTPVFVGQMHVSDTPVGLPVEVELGETASVAVQQTETEHTETGTGDAKRFQKSMEFDIANDRAETVAFELWESLQDGGMKVLSEDRPHTEERGAAIWHLTLKAGERLTLHVRMETPY